MKLGDWAKTERLSHDDVAARLGCSKTSATRYINGQRMPRPAVMARITLVTGGGRDGERLYASLAIRRAACRLNWVLLVVCVSG